MAKKQTRNADPGTAPQPVPTSKTNQERGGLTGFPAHGEQAKLVYEEALVCFDFRAHRIERQDGTGSVAEILADTFVSVLSEHFGFRPIKVMKRVGRWLNITGDRRKEFSHIDINKDAGEIIRHAIDEQPDYFYLSLRLYGEGDKSAILRNALQRAIDSWFMRQIRRPVKIPKEFCYFYGEPGVCELIACLTNVKDKATISSMIERERRNYLQPEEPTLPSAPPPTERLTRELLEDQLRHTQSKLMELTEPKVQVLQHLLDGVKDVPKHEGTTEENRELCSRVNNIASDFGLRLLYKEQSVNLYYDKRDGFILKTTAEKKQLYGGPTIPHLQAGLRVADKQSAPIEAMT
jgi:hypothetical protein